MLRRAHSRRPGMHRRGRKMRGRGVLDWLKKAGNFIKDHGLISKGASLAAKFLPGQAGAIASTIANGAHAVGLGRRRRRGAGLTLAVLDITLVAGCVCIK